MTTEIPTATELRQAVDAAHAAEAATEAGRVGPRNDAARVAEHLETPLKRIGVRTQSVYEYDLESRVGAALG